MAKRPSIRNPELLQDMELMKEKLGLETDTDLVTVSLKTTGILLDLLEQGYLVGGFKKPGPLGDFDYVTVTLRTIK